MLIQTPPRLEGSVFGLPAWPHGAISATQLPFTKEPQCRLTARPSQSKYQMNQVVLASGFDMVNDFRCYPLGSITIQERRPEFAARQHILDHVPKGFKPQTRKRTEDSVREIRRRVQAGQRPS